jgi:stress-induced morphogen
MSAAQRFPVQAAIEQNLRMAFEPVHHLEVINESHMHNV